MAEAHHELDQPDEARTALLRVEPRRLSQDDRLRQDAIKALLIPRSDEARRLYEVIANRHPADAGAWLDLGRAQEYAGLLGDARQSYERALAADPQNAAAHLRAGVVAADAGDAVRALDGYAEAQRLYAARSNVEGEAETLLRRGSLLEGLGQLAEARATLDKALRLARDNRYQAIRAQLHLSSVTISEGRLDEAARLASAAITVAEEADLDQVAAMGLIELGYSLSQARQSARADEYLSRAIKLASRRGARRTEVRARLQQAALRLDQGQHREALEIAKKALPFLRDGQYRRYELTALTIISRAHEQLGDFGTAKTIADDVLRVAEAAKDQVQIAAALENLAALATIAGDLPLALQQRRRCLEVNRSLQDMNVLPFDLTNTAHLLILLGRGVEAAPLLAEVEEGIARKVAAYEGRARRVAMLKALDAVIAHDLTAVVRFAEAVNVGPRRAAPDSTARLAGALQAYATAHGAARAVIESGGSASVPPDLAPDTKRELVFLQLLTGLARRDWQRTLDGAAAALESRDWPATTEFEWRLAAIGAAAARGLGADDRAHALAARARDALARLRREWKTHADAYERRPDLVALRRQAGIE
jgi:tetratricopeptide (TPR) repeat protein